MNGTPDFIIPECYIDTNIAETLLGIKGCNHQSGCNQVAKVMQEKYRERFAVGIMDADKRRSGYLEEFVKVSSSPHLEIFHHVCRPHFIIMLHPAADGFILASAAEAGIDLAHYGLPSVMKDFKTQTKNVNSQKDPRFKRLFQDMMGEGEFRLLKTVLKYLYISTYKASEGDIAAIFARGY